MSQSLNTVCPAAVGCCVELTKDLSLLIYKNGMPMKSNDNDKMQKDLDFFSLDIVTSFTTRQSDCNNNSKNGTNETNKLHTNEKCL